MGFALLFVLTALAAAAALAVAVRARLRGRAEVLVAATMLWNGIIIAPIYVLGLTGHLWPRTVAVGSLVTSLGVLAAASRGIGPRALIRETWAALLGQLRLPWDALRLAARPARVLFVAVLFTVLLLPYVALSAWFGQQVPHWDPLWYHDTMVGFALQYHSFAMVDLPDTLQKVNGYVRLGEMTQLWMVIFTDRRLADITNLLFAPAIIGAVYALTRRYTSKALALGWGVGVFLMPACPTLIHSTYVDPQNAAHLLAAVLFATIARPRLRDAWLAALALTLAIGSKGLSLVSVPVIGLVGAILLLRELGPARRRDAVLTIVGGACAIFAMAATTYLRNYWSFHNPLWPDLSVDLPSLGIHWPGEGPWVNDPKHGGRPVNINEPPLRLFDHLFALPWSVRGMYVDQAVEYGIGMVWIVLPLGVLAFVGAFVAAARRRMGHYAAGTGGAPPVALAVILGLTLAGSPALGAARYHIAAAGVLVALVAWLTSRPGWERLAESTVSILTLTSLMMFWWVPVSRWWFTPEELVKLIKAPPINRELDRALRAPTLLPVGLAREKELKPGSLVVFNERYAGFPALFWNNTYSNRVQYVKGGPGFLARATQLGATWLVLNMDDSSLPVARAAGSGWQEVGELNPINHAFAFRRVAVPPPPKPAPPPPALPPMLGPPAPPARPAAPPAAKPVAPPAAKPIPKPAAKPARAAPQRR